MPAESHHSNDRETSFLSLSASASFVSSNENCAIYAHQQSVPPHGEKEKELEKPPKSDQQIEKQTAVEKRLFTANSELLQDVLGEAVTDSSVHLVAQERSSCPELYSEEVQQLLSLDDIQFDQSCMERLMMLNTTTITSAIIETDSSSELVSSSSDERTASDNVKETGRSKRSSTKQDGQFRKDHSAKQSKSPADSGQHVRRRMVKAMSQVEPLSLIEKVREIRFAVQRSLDAAEQNRLGGQLRQRTPPSSIRQRGARKKRKEPQSISSQMKSPLPPSDHSFLTSVYEQDQKDHLPASPLTDQAIRSTTQIHTDIHQADAHHLIKSIHQNSSKFDASSANQQYFESQETYANEDQLDYNLNLKNFRLKDDEENQPLSCDHSTSASFQRSPSSSSSSSPSTMLGRAPAPIAYKHDYTRKAKQQIDEEDLDEQSMVCSSAKKQRKSLHQPADASRQSQPPAQQPIVCTRHPYAIKRRAVSLDQLQTNQLCTCSRHLQQRTLDLQQPLQLADLTNLEQRTNIATICRRPFAAPNLPDSSIHFIQPNRLTTSITTHTITTHPRADSSTDRNQQTSSRLPVTSQLTSCTFSSSPSIKCDLIEYF